MSTRINKSQTTRSNNSGSVRPDLVREFLVRLASAWGAIFLFLLLLVFNTGCTTEEERNRVKRMANNLTGCTASLVDHREALDRAEDMSDVAFAALQSFTRCRWAFRESLEAPPVNFTKWTDAQRLDYLSVLVQMREQCEERASAQLIQKTVPESQGTSAPPPVNTIPASDEAQRRNELPPTALGI